MKPRRPVRRRRGDRLLVLAAATILIVMVVSALLPASDDTEPPEPAETDEPVPDGTGPAPSDRIVVGPSASATDRITAQVRGEGGGGPPWLAFEVCATSLPGCAPLWTYSVHQEGAVSTAEVRRPTSFTAADGVRHDCGEAGSCVLRVTADDGSATEYNLVDGPAPGPIDADPDTSEDGGPSRPLSVTVAPPGTDEPAIITVDSTSPRASVTVRLCAQVVPDDRCPMVHVDRTDDEGRSAFALALPRLLTGVVESGTGSVRTDTDCAREPCRLLVAVDGVHHEIVLAFDPAVEPSPPGRLRFVPAGPFEVNQTVTLVGTGFPVVSQTRSALVRWVLCDDLPISVGAVGDLCASPRTVRVASIHDDGSFELPVTVPPSGSLRTWVGARPVRCQSNCWIVVLAEPFPRVVGIPLDMRAPQP